jgi:hypothetical protein
MTPVCAKSHSGIGTAAQLCRSAEAIGASVHHRGEMTMNDSISATANLAPDAAGDGPVQLTEAQTAAVAGGGGGVRVGSDGANN